MESSLRMAVVRTRGRRTLERGTRVRRSTDGKNRTLFKSRGDIVHSKGGGNMSPDRGRLEIAS